MAKPRLLLHICCAPCSTHVIDLLRESYEVEAFFYNPNIHPRKEHASRFEESMAFTEKVRIPLHAEAYNTKEWFGRIIGHENEPEGGERCRKCYELRLEKTAEKASREGFDVFTTTLTISPHKKADIINAIGKKLSQRYEVGFLEADFKKRDGFKKSVELSRRHGLQRQSYCGCIYSIKKEKKSRS